MRLVLTNGHLIDGAGGSVRDAVVVIDGRTIAAAGPAATVPVSRADDHVIDLKGMTLMPGLMDLHIHLHRDATPDLFPHDAVGETKTLDTETDAYMAALMAENARRTLQAGFTTVRDTGAPRDINIDVARAVADGLVKGPRIVSTATIDIRYPPGKTPVHGVVGGNVTGPVEAVKAVREKIGSGADWIHLLATGGGYGQWGPTDPILTLEEMRAATEETHRLGRRTTANAFGSKGIRNAVIAGVQCIEHGSHLHEDDDLIKMMVERNVGWVPTLTVAIMKRDKALEAEARGLKTGIPEDVLKRDIACIEHWRQSFERAMEANVLTAIGTDQGAAHMVHGKNAMEMEQFVKYGATEMQAIEAATRVAAEVMGMDSWLGTVEVGKEADVIVVKDDPLEDIRVLQDNENIVLVIKGGEIVVDRSGTSDPK